MRQSNEQSLIGTIKEKVLGINTDKCLSVLEEPPIKKFKQDDKKEKVRGQNKARPPPFKTTKESNLCPWIADQIAGEPERKCSNQRCTFLHDRKEYLKIKPKDISTECFVFNLSGKCPRGITCRMGSQHLTEDGFNIADVKKFEQYKMRPSSTVNHISKELQNRLRKHKYNFSKAEAIIKANDSSRKKLQQNLELNECIDNRKIDKAEDKRDSKLNVADIELANIIDSNNAKQTEINISNNIKDKKVENDMSNCKISCITEELKIGPVDDSDLIKIRQSEKKTIDWRNKILLSPLTTVGNLPFRRICKEYGADITCGEMALAPKILKGAQEEWALVKRHESENIFGVQLCGNNPGVLTRCAQLLNQEISVDYIDLNLGCPIDLIYRQGGGSGMLNRLNVLETVIKSVDQILNIPLSIKTRTGVYIDKPIAHNLMPSFQKWGVSMITVSKFLKLIYDTF